MKLQIPPVDSYAKRLAVRLRQLEAERARGNLAQLEELEHTTDITLLKKWGWITTMAGAGVSFIALPFIIGVVQHFLPEIICQFLWAFVKLAMGMSLLMFAASIYFTIGPHSE